MPAKTNAVNVFDDSNALASESVPATNVPAVINLGEDDFTEEEKLFILEYPKDKVANQAYMRAFKTKNPRSASVQASRLLARPNIRLAIRKELDKALELARITTDRILQEQSRIAFADIRNAYDPVTNSLKPLHELDDATAAIINSVEVEEIFEPDGEGGRIHVGNTTKVKTSSKQAALDKLMEYKGMAKPENNQTPIVFNINFGHQQLNGRNK